LPPSAHVLALRLSIVGWVLGLVSLCAQSASPFVSGVWSGNVTPTSATVCVRLNATGLRVRLVVGTNEKLSPAVYSTAVTTTSATGNIVTLDIDGLQPATDYNYGIEVAGTLRTETISRGKFRTFPQGAASFRLAFGSCGDWRDPDQRAYDAIVAEQPLLFLNIGDLHYSDTANTVAEDYRKNYDTVLNHANQGALYRSMGVAYIWDDHDFSGNDSNGTSPGTATARTVYRDYVPHYPLYVTGGAIGQAFTVGRVRVIMTDLRSASSPSTNAESASKTRLGAAQKSWFKQELIAARDAGFPLILWASTTPWIATAAVGDDTWGGYATERAELAEFIKDNRIKNVVMLAGDMHAIAYDDGSDSDYATGGGAPLVVLHASPLTRPANSKGGPYTAGPIEGTAQYGLLEVTDTGGQTIQARFTGKRVGEGAKLVFQFNASMSGITPTGVSGPSNGNDRAFVNVSTRGRITASGDSLVVGFVVGGTSARNVLARAVGPSLAAFGLTDALPRPAIKLYRGSTVLASNENWTTADISRLSNAFDRAGAFPLSPTSPDAALFLSLAPGAYTLEATGLGGTVGTVLIETYDVP
jgi:phosphodiesterase/alkaline phosphatase D-like protein